MTVTRREALQMMPAVGLATLLACGAQSALPGPAESLSPEDFGAAGDGVTDDTRAFVALSREIAHRNGGVVELRPQAIYSVGRQTAGNGQYLAGHPVLFVESVSHFEVLMNGATLKFRDGLKFGSFDRSGRPMDTNLPFMKRENRADIGYAISARNVARFIVRDGRIDCNSRKAVIGGFWGDTGRQCIHYGIAAFACNSVELSDLTITDSCLDGILYAFDGLTARQPPQPLLVRNVTIDRVGRNCVSVVGTNQALFSNCTLQGAGGAPNEVVDAIRSAPAACIDIEAENAECRNIRIEDSRLLSGPGTAAAFIADSGTSSDILIENSDILGVFWTSKPRTIVRNSRIRGTIARLYGGDEVPGNNSLIAGSELSDVWAGSNQPGQVPYFIDLEGAGEGVRIEDSRIDVQRSKLNLRGGILDGVRINFSPGVDRLKNRDFAILADGARMRDVVIRERIPSHLRPADAFYITSPASGSDAVLVSETSKLLWTSWSPGAGGHVGRLRD